jgi:putative ABC transport system ATP-binding protein
MSLIQTENLTKIYGSGETAVIALDYVGIQVKEGEFVAVMAPAVVANPRFCTCSVGWTAQAKERLSLMAHLWPT